MQKIINALTKAQLHTDSTQKQHTAISWAITGLAALAKASKLTKTAKRAVGTGISIDLADAVNEIKQLKLPDKEQGKVLAYIAQAQELYSKVISDSIT